MLLLPGFSFGRNNAPDQSSPVKRYKTAIRPANRTAVGSAVCARYGDGGFITYISRLKVWAVSVFVAYQHSVFFHACLLITLHAPGICLLAANRSTLTKCHRPHVGEWVELFNRLVKCVGGVGGFHFAQGVSKRLHGGKRNSVSASVQLCVGQFKAFHYTDTIPNRLRMCNGQVKNRVYFFSILGKAL